MHVGQLGTIGEAGQFLALAQGYFAQQGLAIDAVQVDPAKTTAALLSGELDVLGGAAAARLFVTVASN